MSSTHKAPLQVMSLVEAFCNEAIKSLFSLSLTLGLALFLLIKFLRLLKTQEFQDVSAESKPAQAV
ncbi:hypothetical protein D3C86_2149930 [compost metagenome]